MADFTQVQGQLLDWTLLDDTATDAPTVDSGNLSIASYLETILHIAICHADANDASTSYVYVKVLTKKGAGLEDWVLFTQFTSGGGQAVKEDVAAQSASGQTHIEVADTTDWDTGQLERLFILDATAVNSELVTIMGWADNDYYIADENLTNTHESTADLLSGVNEHVVSIPGEFQTVKVLFGNSHGTATYYVRVDYEAITDIE